MASFDDFLVIADQKHTKGSAQCPECGKFARVIRESQYYNGVVAFGYITVDCKRCGVQSIGFDL